MSCVTGFFRYACSSSSGNLLLEEIRQKKFTDFDCIHKINGFLSLFGIKLLSILCIYFYQYSLVHEDAWCLHKWQNSRDHAPKEITVLGPRWIKFFIFKAWQVLNFFPSNSPSTVIVWELWIRFRGNPSKRYIF